MSRTRDRHRVALTPGNAIPASPATGTAKTQQHA